MIQLFKEEFKEYDEPTKDKSYYFNYNNFNYGIYIELWDYPNNVMVPDYSVFINLFNDDNPDNNLYFTIEFNDARSCITYFERLCKGINSLCKTTEGTGDLEIEEFFKNLDYDTVDTEYESDKLFDVITKIK